MIDLRIFLQLSKTYTCFCIEIQLQLIYFFYIRHTTKVIIICACYVQVPITGR